METPASTLKNRIDTMTREAVGLRAATQASRTLHSGALVKYAAGLVALSDVETARSAQEAAETAERAHGAALDVALRELRDLHGQQEEADALRELAVIAEKLDLIEGDMMSQIERAERELREAYSAARESMTLARELRTRGQVVGFRLIALRGGLDASQTVPTPMEREEMLDALRAWKVRQEDARTPPPSLFAVPINPQESRDDHARRWRLERP